MAFATEALARVIRQFPETSFACAYGSAVMKQAGYNYYSKDPEKLPMVDFIFAVKDPYRWHEMNIAMNPHHYSFVKSFGIPFIVNLQDNGGGRIYYHTYITVNDIRLKYGVISEDALMSDLKHWNQLYVAGRLQKPVVILKEGSESVQMALEANRMAALHAAIALLPPTFSTEDLYMTITSLSYSGDVRMQLGAENPNKIRNIVVSSRGEFDDCYRSLIKHCSFIQPNGSSPDKDVSASASASASGLSTLHEWEKIKQPEVWNFPRNIRQHLPNVSASEPIDPLHLRQSLRDIVAATSTAQTFKGLLSAGVVNAVQIAWSKWQKGRTSLSQ